MISSNHFLQYYENFYEKSEIQLQSIPKYATLYQTRFIYWWFITSRLLICGFKWILKRGLFHIVLNREVLGFFIYIRCHTVEIIEIYSCYNLWIWPVLFLFKIWKLHLSFQIINSLIWNFIFEDIPDEENSNEYLSAQIKLFFKMVG